MDDTLLEIMGGELPYSTEEAETDEFMILLKGQAFIGTDANLKRVPAEKFAESLNNTYALGFIDGLDAAASDELKEIIGNSV